MAGIIRPLMYKFLGLAVSLILAVPMALGVAFRKGFGQVLHVKSRTRPPALLNDPKWGTHRYIQLSGLKMHYVEKGDETNPLMIFVHGFPEFWFSWRHQLTYFAKDYW
jgi:hypothetical protein